MSTPRTLAAVLAGCVVAASLLLWMQRGERGSAVALPASQATAGLSEVPGVNERNEVAVDVPEEASTPEVVEPESVRAPTYEAPVYGPRERTPDDVFEAMYGAMTLAELAAQKGMVEVEFFEAQHEIVEERFAAGLYEEQIVEKAESVDALLADPELRPTWAPSKNLTGSTRTEGLADGRLLKRRTVLPYEEYPDHYYRSDELGWLNRRITKLQSAKLSSSQQ